MTMPDGPRYEDDFYAWTQYRAGVLRSMSVPDNRFDREHVVDEIYREDWCPTSTETR